MCATSNSSDDDETDKKYSVHWFTEWMESLKTKLIYKLPILMSDDIAAVKEAARAYRQAKSSDNIPEREDDAAQEEEEGAVVLQQTTTTTTTTTLALKDCFQAAQVILDEMDRSNTCLCINDKELLQLLVLGQATPAKLAAYCQHEGQEKTARLMQFLLKSDNNDDDDDVTLLQQMLLNGGANHGMYGPALDIYHDILQEQLQNSQQQRQQYSTTTKDVLQRLALAVALELCSPIHELDSTSTVVVDPVQRYLHYEEAYLKGDLDAAFETLTVWEMRMVVDSDASNQEIEWCREMLLNYRPDIAYMGDPMWRYSSIVKTDVKFGRPDYMKEQKRDYYQMFARGGKSDVRAMCGRLVNKAFGIPCVPVLQPPSHSAMAKWSPKGWNCVFGSNVGRCCGDRRSFLDFCYETNIRTTLGNETYLLKVQILDWMAEVMSEAQMDSFPDPDSPWHTLAIMQRKRLGEMDEASVKGNAVCNITPKILEIRQRKEPEREQVTIDDYGTIVVPMSARDKDRSVTWMKSCDHGKQMNAKENWWIDYNFPVELVSERRTYALTMKICSIHDNDPHPFLWIVTSPHCTEKPMTEYSVPFVYTCGAWGETEPIEIELGGGEETLKVMRQKPCRAVTVKEFKLTPV